MVLPALLGSLYMVIFYAMCSIKQICLAFYGTEPEYCACVWCGVCPIIRSLTTISEQREQKSEIHFDSSTNILSYTLCGFAMEN